MVSDDRQNTLLERQIEAVAGDFRLIVHMLDADGQARWHLAARSVAPAPPGWVSISCGRERTTLAAMHAVEAEANRRADTAPGAQPLQGQARLKHAGVEFLLAPVASRGTSWTIYPTSGPANGADSGASYGDNSFPDAFEAAQAAIDTWLTLHPADRGSTVH